jgi:hypothetical protein
MWHLVATISAKDNLYSTALSDGLATDSEIDRTSETQFQFTLNEKTAKDLRAMWNTRMRGIIACDNVLKELEELRKTR